MSDNEELCARLLGYAYHAVLGGEVDRAADLREAAERIRVLGALTLGDVDSEIPFPEGCPDVTYGMANAASEAFDNTLCDMGIRLQWASLVPYYYAAQAVIDHQRKASKS